MGMQVTQIPSGGGLTLAAADARYLQLTGGTLTGQLLNTFAGTALRIAHYGTNIDIYDDDNTTRRWWTAAGRTFATDYNTRDDTSSLGGDSVGGLRLGSGVPVAWSSTTSWFGAPSDTLITRAAAGVIGLNTTANADVGLASTHSAHMYFSGARYKVMLVADP